MTATRYKRASKAGKGVILDEVCATCGWASQSCSQGSDSDGVTVAIGDYAGQARQAMLNLEIALHEAGAELTDVVKSTVYVATSDQDDLVAAWEVVRERFGAHDAPSTLLGVAVLGYDHQLVEAVAAVRPAPGARFQREPIVIGE